MNKNRTGSDGDTNLTPWRSPTVPTLELLGFTYFIRVGASIKIGSAANFKRRLHALQTAHVKPIDVLAVVPATIADEYTTHQRFAHLRERGEWFRADRDLLEFIERVKVEAAPERTLNPPQEPTPVQNLIAIRRKHGWNSPIGFRCSNLAEMLPNYEAAVDPAVRANLARGIQTQMTDLARLLAA